MKKELRKMVYEKYGGRCAYCGKKLNLEEMQVDHRVPLYRNDTAESLAKYGIVKGTDDFSNLMPSCRSCNFRKGTLSVDEFRREIRRQCDNIIKRSFQVRMSLDYGLLTHNDKEIEFYFERLNNEKH